MWMFAALLSGVDCAVSQVQRITQQAGWLASHWQAKLSLGFVLTNHIWSVAKTKTYSWLGENSPPTSPESYTRSPTQQRKQDVTSATLKPNSSAGRLVLMRTEQLDSQMCVCTVWMCRCVWWWGRLFHKQTGASGLNNAHLLFIVCAAGRPRSNTHTFIFHLWWGNICL